MQQLQPTCTYQQFSEALQSPEIIQYLFEKVPTQATNDWLFSSLERAYSSFISFLSKLSSNQSYAEDFANVLRHLSSATYALRLGAQDFTSESNTSAYKTTVDMLFIGSIIDFRGTSEFSLGIIERWTDIKDKLEFMIDRMLANHVYRQSIIYKFQHCTREMHMPICMQHQVLSFRAQDGFEYIRRLFTPTIHAQLCQQFQNTYFECFILNGDCTSLRIFSRVQNELLNQQRKSAIVDCVSQLTTKMYPVFNPVAPCLSIISEYL
jgi:hypothetical protein